MEPLDPQSLPWLALFVLPGFIAAKVYDLLVPTERRAWSDRMIEVAAYGTINFALWFWLIDLLSETSAMEPWRYRLGMSLVLFVSPALLGMVAFLALGSRWMRGVVRHPMPTAWDRYFGQARPCWIRCHLRDGRVIGGLFGEDSFAGASPHREDIYIEQAWKLDRRGTFTRPVPGSVGMLVSVEECRFIDFLEIGVGHDEGDLEGSRVGRPPSQA